MTQEVLILASSSPRRLELLRQVNVTPDRVMAPDVDETPLRRELPRAYARRMAETKMRAVDLSGEGGVAFVVAADTVVACGRRILPKTESEDEAASCLDLLAGRRHRVLGAVCVAGPGQRRSLKVVETVVHMRRLGAAERRSYLASGEWAGKAGGYAIQGLAASFVPAINGSYTNVVGLPVVETLMMLEGLGWRPRP